ncbi:class IIb bacteriocin, lactobin A/cerein 7B family [Pseudolactococcus carnosus]|uniref:Class IIb bacteriocin, lactobin A/cerein 7B family n=1 Tax=Pseudolactococcus carnosus TaxID=2749961 RepID=A0ABT0ATE5_9LACT|nr:class IIb bacteriocin, lactobin A/cerein 7B family [Lactococcus carnosus]MCJ1989969.1 class IIb bacteriocin, lactobin A/cerein 7B family [Lactococcus carnosus]MCJ2003388.1 class IIb bacteriocin, lactobin A/cerein 7B family [Lactococcus carnosus]
MKHQKIVELNAISIFKELSEAELVEVNGGIAPLVAIGGFLLISFTLGAVNGCSDARKK